MKVIYWSGTGNTEKMAQLIVQGIKDAGGQADSFSVSEMNSVSVAKEDLVILGCPAMGAEELEPVGFEPFLDSIGDKLSGKKAVLFGSYGWGNGEWMDVFKEKVSTCGATVVLDPLILQYEPDEDQCIEYGKSIAKL